MVSLVIFHSILIEYFESEIDTTQYFKLKLWPGRYPSYKTIRSHSTGCYAANEAVSKYMVSKILIHVYDERCYTNFNGSKNSYTKNLLTKFRMSNLEFKQ